MQLRTDLAFRTLRPDTLVKQSQQMMGVLTGLAPELLKSNPKMPWNGSLTSERRFAWVEVPFQTTQAIRTALGGTVNDVAMAVMARGLARYLRQHGHFTDGVELRDMVTVSLRHPDERGTVRNRVRAAIAPPYVGIDDPVQRLRAEQAAMDRVTQRGLAGVLDQMMALSDLVPPVVGLAATLPRPAVPIQILQQAIFSVISSNIPGRADHCNCMATSS